MEQSAERFLLQDSQTVVFIGDSITDCGRRLEARPFGAGFMRFAVDLVTARYPQRKIKFVNRGISGDVSVGLRQRWDEDVIAHKPDWVSVMIGINDVHRSFLDYGMMDVPPELYRTAYLDCLSRTADQTRARLVLMDPFYICKDPPAGSVYEEVLRVLPDYIAIVHEMAERFQTLHVPTHDIFQQHLQHRPAETFCPEPVHPNPTGHMVIAHAWLNALGW